MKRFLARIDRANLLLALASVALTLLALEGVLRISGSASGIAHVGNARRMGRRPNALILDCYRSNPRGYFDISLSSAATRERYVSEKVKGLDRVWRDYPYVVEYRYNSAGFRGGEFLPQRPTPGVKRVAFIGDSFTEGQGVRDADTFVRVLDRDLNQQGPGQWALFNLGARGVDFPGMMRLFERADRLDPDAIVYAMVLNDVSTSPAYDARWPEFSDRLMNVLPPERMPFWDSRLARFVVDRVTARQRSEECVRWYKARYDEPNREGWEQTKRQIRRMARTCRGRNIRMALVLWPLLVALDGDYPFEEIHRKVKSLCAEEGIPFHDLLPALRGQRTSTLWVHAEDDHHPNEVAHRLAANSLRPFLRELLDDPSRPKGPRGAGGTLE